VPALSGAGANTGADAAPDVALSSFGSATVTEELGGVWRSGSGAGSAFGKVRGVTDALSVRRGAAVRVLAVSA
jgi:hypothetical protein